MYARSPVNGRARRCTLLVLLALSPAALAAEGEPRIGLIDVRATQGAAPAQGAQIRSALAATRAKSRSGPAGDPPAVKAAYGPGVEASLAPGVEKARQRAKEGKKLFDDLDPQGAEAK